MAGRLMRPSIRTISTLLGKTSILRTTMTHSSSIHRCDLQAISKTCSSSFHHRCCECAAGHVNFSTLSPPKDFSALKTLTPECNFSPGVDPLANLSDPDMDLIFQRNRSWAAKQKEEDPQYFERMSAGQKPKYMFVGCADNRIPAETIMGMRPGDLFVHRNVANLAVNGDINFLSVLHFAVEQLKVGHIIVCGHYGCAGVYHAMHPTDTGGILENWLRNIRDVQRLHHDELQQIPDDGARFKRVVELNVIEQCVNIFKFGILQRSRKASRLATGKNVPQIHALVYDISTGLLHELPLRAYFKHYSDRYMSIYELN